MNRSEILQTAERLVTGDRAVLYGDYRKNYASVAILWKAYFEAQDTPCPNFEAEDVLMMLALMKIGRGLNGDYADNYVDACGYLALVGEAVTGA
jgi:hypothetical protein